MSLFALKRYQEQALDELRAYFAQSCDVGAKTAFVLRTDRPYHRVERLEGAPYVCIRIPTGGGKTVVACHAVGIAATEFLRQERALVLWLVPTNTIKDQTLAAIRDRSHPYRQALDASTGGNLTVMDLQEALHIQRGTLDGDTVVIVSTLAALRVEDTEGRKVYEQNGSLMSHFSDCPRELLEQLECYPDTETAIPSLANVLRLRHPIVVVDEAHNARTSLSFDTLARFEPSCIIEFTATPATKPPNPSNVLYHVSAFQLKSEDMIKLPIRLQTNGNWKEVISAAIAKRTELEQVARQERASTGEYLRPIALLQAQPRRADEDTLTVETVKQSLLELSIPETDIAIETGQDNEVGQWERDNRASVFDETCPIRYIITVDKLREGWDCPFAYVLCSVRDVKSKTAVEQILGRVLRMPKATRKEHDELNYAYAFARSHHFGETAEGLADALVANGFTRFEAGTGVESGQGDLGFDQDFGGLFRESRQRPSPAERGEPLHVPQLALWVDGELEAIDETHFLQYPWNLAECGAALAESEFPSRVDAAQDYEIDITKRGDATVQRAEAAFVSDIQLRLALLMPRDITDPGQLAVWLDRRIPHPDIPQSQSIVFLLRLVEHLTKERGLPLDDLARRRLSLRDAAARKIAEHRQKVVRTAYQQILFGDMSAQVEVSAERVFSYDPLRYPANTLYEGPVQFQKHYYRAIGAMNNEETRCAEVIDSLPNVKYWVRNLERRPDTSFWMQTSTDRFYPDFVALLDDDRILAVEYKGDMLADTEDTHEKRALGGLWEAKSDGRCLFMLVGRDDYEARIGGLASAR